MGTDLKAVQRKYLQEVRTSRQGQTLPWYDVMDLPIPPTIWAEGFDCERQKIYRANMKPDQHWLRIGLNGELVLLKEVEHSEKDL